MEEKQTFKISIIIALLILGFGYFFFLLLSIKHPNQTVKNHSVYFAKNNLVVFDDTYDFAHTADRVSFHGDLVLVQIPLSGKTVIYSLKKEKIVKTYPYMMLDYDGKNGLYYKNGRETFFNHESLGLSCQFGYIEDVYHVLCVVPKQEDNLDNKVIRIDTITKEKTDVYLPQNTISTVMANKKKVYVGEYNLQTHQDFITVNTTSTASATITDFFFIYKNNVYAASLPNDFNNHIPSYSKVTATSSKVAVSLIEKGKIVFWKK